MNETTQEVTETEVTEAPVTLTQDEVHEGKLFRNYIKLNYLTMEEMAVKLNVSRQAIYLQTMRPYLSTRFKKRLKALGAYPFEKQEKATLKVEEQKQPNGDAKLMQEIIRLQQIVVLQAEHIREMGKLITNGRHEG